METLVDYVVPKRPRFLLSCWYHPYIDSTDSDTILWLVGSIVIVFNYW